MERTGIAIGILALVCCVASAAKGLLAVAVIALGIAVGAFVVSSSKFGPKEELVQVQET